MILEGAGDRPPFVWHRADGKPEGLAGPMKGWRPSIHMPRWACRDVLEVLRDLGGGIYDRSS